MELWVTITFWSFPNFLLYIQCFYNQQGEKNTIKSIESASHKYWFSYWAKGSFTIWEALIFPLWISPQEKKLYRLFVYGPCSGGCNIKSAKWRWWSLSARWLGKGGDPATLDILYSTNIKSNLSSSPQNMALRKVVRSIQRKICNIYTNNKKEKDSMLKVCYSKKVQYIPVICIMIFMESLTLAINKQYLQKPTLALFPLVLTWFFIELSLKIGIVIYHTFTWF